MVKKSTQEVNQKDTVEEKIDTIERKIKDILIDADINIKTDNFLYFFKNRLIIKVIKIKYK